MESRKLNLEVMDNFIRFINSGDIVLGQSIIAPDVVFYAPTSPEPMHGFQGYTAVLDMMRGAMPDVRWKADEIIAQAESKANELIEEATVAHEAAMEKNRQEIEKEKQNLYEAQRQVTEFKKTLFDMYKSHLEMISAMPEIEIEEEEEIQEYETEEEEPPKPDPFATSSFSARNVKGVYESRFSDLQFGQNNSQSGNQTSIEKEEV